MNACTTLRPRISSISRPVVDPLGASVYNMNHDIYIRKGYHKTLSYDIPGKDLLAIDSKELRLNLSIRFIGLI